MTRVLFLGENWYGSCARACSFSLRRLGCDVEDVDVQTVFPQVTSRPLRLARRLAFRLLAREYNRQVLAAARRVRPDIVLAFKAAQVMPSTLRELRALGARLYNYYPDTSAFAHDGFLAESLPEYDCVFYTKPFWDRDVRARVELRASALVPHGFDPDLHRPLALDERDRETLGADVAVIATRTPHKERTLDALLAQRPTLGLRIWGNGWERARSPRVLARVEGGALHGTLYAKAIQASRINLALMSGPVEGASRGDETTTRTFEIPACGGFMLHERTPELLTLFREDEEVACFGSVEELAAKIDHYLAHDDERRAIAKAGHARCVPAYSYDARMAEILAWHREHGGRR